MVKRQDTNGRSQRIGFVGTGKRCVQSPGACAGRCVHGTWVATAVAEGS